MAYFTQEDYRKIEEYLNRGSKRDTDFQETSELNGDEIIAIVQEGINKKVRLRNLVFNTIEDFINVTDKYNAPYISLDEAIRYITGRKRKEGQIITFLNIEGNWVMYQFKGVISQWNHEDLWVDLFDFDKYIIKSILPDEEDLTRSEIDADGNSYISIKDVEPDQKEYIGHGRKILRRNIVELESSTYGSMTKNILYQDMMDQPNTTYEIKYDFDLNGGTLVVPEGCILDFKGGTIVNGIIVMDGTKVFPQGCIIEEYIGATVQGSYHVGQCFYDEAIGKPKWFNGTVWTDAMGVEITD